ncbi:MAG: hypothetical protein ACOWWM_12480 [Desulfobacterales bacterium]
MKAPCLFCRKPTTDRGLFIPYDPTEYGGDPGRVRAFIYPICDSCRDTGFSFEKIEAIAKLAGTGASVH